MIGSFICLAQEVMSILEPGDCVLISFILHLLLLSDSLSLFSHLSEHLLVIPTLSPT